MMRAWAGGAPGAWPSSNCSSPSSLTPARARAQAAALPSAPSPTTTASQSRSRRVTTRPLPIRGRPLRSLTPLSPPAHGGRAGAAEGEAGPPHGGEPAAVGPRGHAALDALAHGPVLAVDQVPEVGGVRGGEAGPGAR